MDPSQLPLHMTSPSEMFDDLVKRYRVNKSKLSRRVGVTYTTLNAWTKGEFFNEENQQKVLRELRQMVHEGEVRIPEGLGDDFFTENAARARKARRGKRTNVIELFATETKIGRTMTPQERQKLELIDHAFDLDIPLCQSLVMSMRGKLSDPQRAAEHQRQIVGSTKAKKARS